MLLLGKCSRCGSETILPGGNLNVRSHLFLNAQQWAVDRLDTLGSRLRSTHVAPHLALGLRGEREALFELRRRGYTVVARRWTSTRLRGDIDLIAWDDDWLCFVEVKARSGFTPMAPAETAVDHEKQAMLRRMASAYLRSFPEERRREIPVRFDVISVYLEPAGTRFELFRGAFGWH